MDDLSHLVKLDVDQTRLELSADDYVITHHGEHKFGGNAEYIISIMSYLRDNEGFRGRVWILIRRPASERLRAFRQFRGFAFEQESDAVHLRMLLDRLPLTALTAASIAEGLNDLGLLPDDSYI